MSVNKGDLVRAHHPRGGLITGRVVKRERISGYGPRFVLDSGYSIAAADIIGRYVEKTAAELMAERTHGLEPLTRLFWHQSEMRRGILCAFGTCRILSIDAWRDGAGWTYNNWHAVGLYPLRLLDLKPRAMLREMRDRGYISRASAGRVAINDDGYNVEIVDKGTREPLFAIEYGSVLQ